MTSLRGRRVAVSALVAFTAGFFACASAKAAAPTITTTDFHQTIVDTQTCAFPNTQVFTGTVRTITYPDGRVTQQFTLVGTITAHGNTLTDTDHYTIHTSTTGDAKMVGLVIHIVLPGAGLIMIDAGKIALSPSGEVRGFTGRQDQLTGNSEAFCEALT